MNVDEFECKLQGTKIKTGRLKYAAVRKSQSDMIDATDSNDNLAYE